MADIKLVLKLSEEDYIEICKCAYPNDVLVGELVYQVRNNKPLPQGHGRIGDMDLLLSNMKERDEDNGGEPLNAVDRGYHLAVTHLQEEIDSIKPVIEADKENKDGSN